MEKYIYLIHKHKNMSKTALITGVTGQDGAYLAKLLLEKGYTVYGAVRRTSTKSFSKLEKLGIEKDIKYVDFDLLEQSNIRRTIEKIQPDEIYNLAAQSFVELSFQQPTYTSMCDGIGVLYILEAIRDINPKIKFYQASTSELYGLVQAVPQSESTPFYPRSPYAVAKLYAYWITVNYREAYNMYACNGILFNHESPQRGETFVTRKITRATAKIALGMDTCLYLGNLDAKRDWGHAKDYVEMQWRMLQQETPEDFVIATGHQESVRRFIDLSAEQLGWGAMTWEGKGLQETGRRSDTGDIVVRIDPRYFRPTEVELLIGDPTKAKEKLGWKLKYDLPALVKDMMASDVKLFTK